MRKNNISKKMTAILTAVLLLGSLTACGDKQPVPQTGDGGSEAGTVVIDDMQGAEQSGEAAGAGQGSEASDAGQTDAQQEDAQAGTITELTGKVTLFSYETEETLTYEGGAPFPYAYAVTPGLELDEASAAQYPKLAAALKSMNEDNQTLSKYALANMTGVMSEDLSYGMEPFYSCYEEAHANVTRADAQVLSFLVTTDSFYNGAHPNIYYNSRIYDSQTGEILGIGDIFKNRDALIDVIVEHLDPIAVDPEEGFAFDESDIQSMRATITDEVEQEYLHFTMGEEGVTCHFDPYELMYYALGPIESAFSYAEYPELFNEKYVPDHSPELPAGERFPEDPEAEKTLFTVDELLSSLPEEEQWNDTEGDGDDAGYHVVECPDWDVTYLADGIFDTLTEPPFTIREVSHTYDEYYMPEPWAKEHGIELPAGFVYGPSYSDDMYTYWVNNDAANGYMSIELYDASGSITYGTFDLSAYLNPPVVAPEDVAYTEMAIDYAAARDGVLYVEIGHRTYAASQPCTAFILAIRIEDGALLWKSDYQVAGAQNFLIGEDTIICGYGFTREPDYLYVLSRHSGAKLQTIKLHSAPEYFIPEDDSLIVLTYDTIYEYNISMN